MFGRAWRTLGEVVEAGIDAAKATFGGFFGASGKGSGEKQDSFSTTSEGTVMPVEQDQEVHSSTAEDTVMPVEQGQEAHSTTSEDTDKPVEQEQKAHSTTSEDTDKPVEQDQKAHSATSEDTDIPVEQDQEETVLNKTSTEETSENKKSGDDDSQHNPFWVNGTFQRYDQIGFYNFTIDPTVCGFYLDPKERWIQLHNKLFSPNKDMEALEAKYYLRIEELAAETDQQKYLNKISYLKESKETQEYSDQLTFEALTQAHEKYSTDSSENARKGKSAAGRKPIPFKLALGSLIVQSIMGTSDRGTGRLMSENPFIQYFCGYSFFSTDHYISHSKLSELKKVFDSNFMEEINEVFLKMELEEIHLNVMQKAKEDLEKAQKAVTRAEKSFQKAQAEEEEIKSRFDGMATKEEIKAAEEKTKAAEEKVKKAEKQVKKAQERVKALEPKEQDADKQDAQEQNSKKNAQDQDAEKNAQDQDAEKNAQDQDAEKNAQDQDAEKNAQDQDAEKNAQDQDAEKNAQDQDAKKNSQERGAEKQEAQGQDAKKNAQDQGGEEQENQEQDAEKQNSVSATNAGSISIDATCNPGNAKFPMDFDLLNDARKKTDEILSVICSKTGATKPRTNKLVLQLEVKNLSKKKKKTEDDIRKVIKHLLQAIEHIFKCIDKVCQDKEYELTLEETYNLMLVKTIYGQQRYMFEKNVRRVPNRIVSFSMPQLRPIVRGKVVNDVEFGPKTEITVDANGFVRLENFSFDSFNEGTRLVDAIMRYKERTGYYPEVVRCDQIYRTRENRAFCKEKGIRISGPRLGRKTKDEEKLKEQIELEKADMVDRIEVERQFSRQKHCWGVGRIMERTPERMEHAVGMAVFLNNLVPVGF